MKQPVYPVTMKWTEFEIPLVNNDTLVWKGQAAHVVDSERDIFNAPGLVMNTPWYHCKACIDAEKGTFVARASIGSKFCSECGAELDWDNLERDESSEADENARLRAELDQLAATVPNQSTRDEG